MRVQKRLVPSTLKSGSGLPYRPLLLDMKDGVGPSSSLGSSTARSSWWYPRKTRTTNLKACPCLYSEGAQHIVPYSDRLLSFLIRFLGTYEFAISMPPFFAFHSVFYDCYFGNNWKCDSLGETICYIQSTVSARRSTLYILMWTNTSMKNTGVQL